MTRFVMGAELIAFSDMFGVAITLRKELKDLPHGGKVPMKLLTDSKTLFDVISKGLQMSEKRPMLDIS